MSRDQMQALMSEELERIPKRTGQHQRDLRMLYNAMRLHSLGKNAAGNRTAADVLRVCVADVQKRHPGAEVNYDRRFFGV